jgi:hypothetical protein
MLYRMGILDRPRPAPINAAAKPFWPAPPRSSRFNRATPDSVIAGPDPAIQRGAPFVRPHDFPEGLGLLYQKSVFDERDTRSDEFWPAPPRPARTNRAMPPPQPSPEFGGGKGGGRPLVQSAAPFAPTISALGC